MAENDDAVRDAARSRIATQLLAGALAFSGTTYPPILLLDIQDFERKDQAARMVKNSVKLADMLLAELDKEKA